MQLKKILAWFLGISSFLISQNLHAQKLPIFYIGGYGGYGVIDGAYHSDGQFTQGRFALGMHAVEFRHLDVGGEIGIQSGNTMRLDSSRVIVDQLTSVPPQATLKPLLDALITFKGQLSEKSSLQYILKGGIAYRQLQLNDRTSNYGDYLSNVTGEFQAGLGFNITEQVFINAFYQGIYSNSNAGVYLDSSGNTPIAHIPTQQAGFLGVEYSFF